MRCASAILSLAIGSSACGSSGDPVKALLEEIEIAVEARDAEGVAALLSADFQAESGQSRMEATRTLRRFFLGYESIELDRIATEVERGESTAQVRCWVELTGRARPMGGLGGLLPPDATYRFDVGLVQADEGWLVSRVGWERAQPRVE